MNQIRTPHTFEIAIDDLKISVAANNEDSDDQWVLCLHGIQANKEVFGGLFEDQLAAEFSVIAIDLVGFGQSSKPGDFPYDIQDQVAVVAQLVRKLNVRRLHIIGHSLGGMIGTLLLNPLKDVVDSFVNMEGNLQLADCGLSKAVSQCPYPIFQAHEFGNIKDSIRHSALPGSADRARWMDEIPDFVFYRTCQSIVQLSSTGKLVELFKDAQCRKLFVYGALNSKKTDCLPESITRAQIPNAGHFVLQENPTACYRAIRDFLHAPGLQHRASM